MDATVGIRSVDGLVTIHVLISVYVYCCVHTSSSLSLGFSLSSACSPFFLRYLIFIGHNLHDAVLAPPTVGLNTSAATVQMMEGGVAAGAVDPEPISVTGFIMIAALLLVPLQWLKSLKKLAFTSLIADVVIVFGLLVIYSYGFMEMASPTVINGTTAKTEAAKFATFPMFFGLAVYTVRALV